MVFDFLTAAKGRLAYVDPTANKRELASEIIKYGSGKNDEGWWDSAKMVEQVSFYNIIALFKGLFGSVFRSVLLITNKPSIAG